MYVCMYGICEALDVLQDGNDVVEVLCAWLVQKQVGPLCELATAVPLKNRNAI
jgi:hypothetical protein